MRRCTSALAGSRGERQLRSDEVWRDFLASATQSGTWILKVVSVKPIPLGGATHDHGWPGGTDPNVQYNTLVEVISDEGISGLGSCYTTRALVEGALKLLEPHLIGEAADEPERVSEK